MHSIVRYASFIIALQIMAGLIHSASAEDISISGWRLWLDREAHWQDDALFLPDEVDVAKLPVNIPTGGWEVLSDQQGLAVTLPSTVEEHYWGKFGTRLYTKHEAQRGADTSFPNGNYLGVSWWWREISAPKFKRGQRMVVSFRGARLRAEVYCNGKLCGYTIMTELPFQADITDAVKPGQKAQLAVRITNPGGNLDWIDFAQMQIRWGQYILPPSRGFGGLDNDIHLDVRDNVAIADLAAINKPDLHQVHLVAEVTSVKEKYRGLVHFQISRHGQTVWRGDSSVTVGSGETKTVELDAVVEAAEPWDIQHPNLYQASAALDGLTAAGRSVDFGFRYFTAKGIGTEEAKLTLNDKRIVAISAISWGYWGRNGLWPDQEMAEREVSAAKAMGLNCLQFHRNIGKPAVLDVQDRAGLLRAEEPGAGKFVIGARYAKGPFGTNDEFLGKDERLLGALEPKKGYVQPDVVDTSGSGPEGDARAFWEKYTEAKILQMVKRDRSHPSLITYILQNEASELDIRNPRIYRILRRIHALDPSRIIVFFSGGVPKDQVLMLPYSEDIRAGSKSIPFAGWKDVHTCGGPCNYLDNLYTDPSHFSGRQKEEDHKEICMWGEMLGAACPDDYDKLVHSFDANHPTGYELDDMTKILAGYHQFLDKWGFRQAFPTDSSLFQAIGYRTYYFWQRVIELARVDNANDYLVISGWESTTIDNHSGLLDNHRFFKADPAVLAKACRPEMLVIQPRHIIVAKGDKDLVDVFLINETNRSGPHLLTLTAKRPDGSRIFTTERPVVVAGGDTFGQLLTEAIELPPADAAGMMTLLASLTPTERQAAPLTQDEQVEVIDVAGAPIFQNVAVAEQDQEVDATLRGAFHVTPLKLAETAPSNHLDAIILASKSSKRELSAAGPISQEVFHDALERVKKDGVRLVLWPDNNFAADAFAKELARENVVKYDGTVGNLNAPWFGDWFFVRKHWLLDGLPADCAMDWRYGVSAFSGPEWLKDSPRGSSTDGLLLDAPGLEAVVGFGADHNPKIGISGCVIPYGKGQIVFYCLPQLVRSLQPGNFAVNQVICQHLLANALRPAAGEISRLSP
jgi:beta-galactosidase